LRGEFTRFNCKLTIDTQHPQRSASIVVIRTTSLAMAWENAVDLLRSAAFFDAAHYPEARFTSIAVMPVSADHYTIKGNLEGRGVTHPIELNADLVDRHLDPQTDTEVGDFLVQGHLERSAFGMAADLDFISDRVDLRISARIQIIDPSG
jgi:polyisoprenoid-binding protein YceI